MKDLVLALTDLNDDTRETCLAQALELGFSKFDLWNLNDAIARVVVDAFGDLDDADIHTAGLEKSEVDAIILAAARYDGETHSDALERGIRLLPSLIAVSSADTLTELGQLMIIFAEYTCGVPSGRTSIEWKAGIDLAGRTLVDEAPKVYADGSTEVIDQAIDFIIENFGALWD